MKISADDLEAEFDTYQSPALVKSTNNQLPTNAEISSNNRHSLQNDFEMFLSSYYSNQQSKSVNTPNPSGVKRSLSTEKDIKLICQITSPVVYEDLLKKYQVSFEDTVVGKIGNFHKFAIENKQAFDTAYEIALQLCQTFDLYVYKGKNLKNIRSFSEVFTPLTRFMHNSVSTPLNLNGKQDFIIENKLENMKFTIENNVEQLVRNQVEKVKIELRKEFNEKLAAINKPVELAYQPPTALKSNKRDISNLISFTICDNCDFNINGVRYKCAFCKDFDLCEKCESLPDVHNPEHFFVKIKKPLCYRFNINVEKLAETKIKTNPQLIENLSTFTIARDRRFISGSESLWGPQTPRNYKITMYTKSQKYSFEHNSEPNVPLFKGQPGQIMTIFVDIENRDWAYWLEVNFLQICFTDHILSDAIPKTSRKIRPNAKKTFKVYTRVPKTRDMVYTSLWRFSSQRSYFGPQILIKVTTDENMEHDIVPERKTSKRVVEPQMVHRRSNFETTKKVAEKIFRETFSESNQEQGRELIDNTINFTTNMVSALINTGKSAVNTLLTPVDNVEHERYNHLLHFPLLNTMEEKNASSTNTTTNATNNSVLPGNGDIQNMPRQTTHAEFTLPFMASYQAEYQPQIAHQPKKEPLLGSEATKPVENLAFQNIPRFEVNRSIDAYKPYYQQPEYNPFQFEKLESNSKYWNNEASSRMNEKVLDELFLPSQAIKEDYELDENHYDLFNTTGNDDDLNNNDNENDNENDDALEVASEKDSNVAMLGSTLTQLSLDKVELESEDLARSLKIDFPDNSPERSPSPAVSVVSSNASSYEMVMSDGFDFENKAKFEGPETDSNASAASKNEGDHMSSSALYSSSYSSFVLENEDQNGGSPKESANDSNKTTEQDAKSQVEQTEQNVQSKQDQTSESKVDNTECDKKLAKECSASKMDPIIAKLFDMGFQDVQTNKKLLAKFNYDLELVLEHLLKS